VLPLHAERVDGIEDLTRAVAGRYLAVSTTLLYGAPISDSHMRAAGLLVSDDGGATWTVQAGATFVGVSFYGLLVDRSDHTHLLAATTNGLYESRDRGVTWVQRLPNLIWSVSMHSPVPTNPASGGEVLAGGSDGVFRSTDGGTHWTPVVMPGVPGGFQPERLTVCHAPGNGSVAYVIGAGAPEVQDPLGGPDGRMPKPYLWRRSAFGGAFTAFAAPPDLQTGQSWYDWFAAVAPNNPDVVFVGGINAHHGMQGITGPAFEHSHEFVLDLVHQTDRANRDKQPTEQCDRSGASSHSRFSAR
jgi:hypothetical protein